MLVLSVDLPPNTDVELRKHGVKYVYNDGKKINFYTLDEGLSFYSPVGFEVKAAYLHFDYVTRPPKWPEMHPVLEIHTQ